MTKQGVRFLLTLVFLGACLMLTAPQEKVAAANNGHVIAMHLAASPANYNGACPTTIRFGGWITMAGGPGKMTYGEFRSDGGHGNGGSHDFEKPGTWRSPELTKWELGGPGKTFNGWVMIGSGNVKSNRAAFRVHCTK
ncbi:MAG TPA: hypothetical protein VKV95_11525 [Terriglobia bacterium]|nr:hypothetical protein [Terriglobia bacterium]